jgi:hypothetical protein
MPVTFAAQIAPRNHRVFEERYCGWPAKENGSDHVVVTAAVRMRAPWRRANSYRYGNFII